MHRALGASEPPGTPFMKPQPSPSKLPAASDIQNKDIPKQHVPQEKETAPHNEENKNVASTKKQIGSMPDNSASAKQQDSGGLFGFGGPKTNADAAKPTESVTGKMFGFGSSIFNSASTLITTPPVSPKVSAAKDTKPPASQAAPKAGQSTCPLCKVGLNLGSKDPPNYNTCTDCKNTVCNQCGFNPMPTKTEVGQHAFQCIEYYLKCIQLITLQTLLSSKWE